MLTKEYNDYNQYVVEVFKTKPSLSQISQATGEAMSQSELEHIWSGGGRVKDEDVWYYLSEWQLEKGYKE
ncbi:hypothetical protein D3C86_1899110 [compost metagenome]